MTRVFIFSLLACCLWGHTLSAQNWTVEPVKNLMGTGGEPNAVLEYFKRELESTVGSPAPDLYFRLVGGDTSLVALRDYKGKTVLINFWSPSCGGCRMQHPVLGKIEDDYSDKGLVVLYVAPHPKEVQQKYFGEHNVSGIKGVIADLQNLQRPYQTFVVPSAMVIDARGIIREVWLGPEKYESIEKRVQPYLQ